MPAAGARARERASERASERRRRRLMPFVGKRARTEGIPANWARSKCDLPSRARTGRGEREEDGKRGGEEAHEEITARLHPLVSIPNRRLREERERGKE